MKLQENHNSTNASGLFHKAASIIAVSVIAVLCYSFSVYAWFNSDISNRENIIKTASYEVTAVVSSVDLFTAGTPVGSEGIELQAGETYTVILVASGGATKGYCVVSDGEQNWYTQNLP